MWGPTLLSPGHAPLPTGRLMGPAPTPPQWCLHEWAGAGGCQGRGPKPTLVPSQGSGFPEVVRDFGGILGHFSEGQGPPSAAIFPEREG